MVHAIPEESRCEGGFQKGYGCMCASCSFVGGKEKVCAYRLLCEVKSFAMNNFHMDFNKSRKIVFLLFPQSLLSPLVRQQFSQATQEIQ